MKHVKLLWIISITILISGCANQPGVVYVPQKCIVDDTPEPLVNNALCLEKDFKCVQDKLLLNYESWKAYAKELVAKQQKCK